MSQISAEIVVAITGAIVILARVIDKLIDRNSKSKAGPACVLSAAAVKRLEDAQPCQCWFEKSDRDRLHEKDTINEIKTIGRAIADLRLDMANRRCPYSNNQTDNK